MHGDYEEFFRVFAQVSKAIHSGENTTEILEHIVDNIKAIFGARGCIYWIIDMERATIEAQVSSGFYYHNLSMVNFSELTTIFKTEPGRRTFIEDATSDRRIPVRDSIGKRRVGSIYGMYFDIIGSLGGILAVYFYDQRELSDKEMDIVNALGEQGAIALQKSLSYDEKMLQNLHQMVEGFALALEAKDENTHGHSVRVARFARAVALEFGLPAAEAATIHHGGLLHDIGKIGMNDDILRRLGILSRREMDVVKQHPVIGVRIIEPLHFLKDVSPLIRHHHERFDGSGYPDGLKEDHIPLGARILTICDAFETMLAGRKHFARMSLEDAAVNLREGAGRQFDPALVDALFSAIRKNPETFDLEADDRGLACLANHQKRLKQGPAVRSQLFI
jgi:putative nucleotidyltransferase with HDIG domain